MAAAAQHFKPIDHNIANTDLKCHIIALDNLWYAFALEDEVTREHGKSAAAFMSQKDGAKKDAASAMFMRFSQMMNKPKEKRNISKHWETVRTMTEQRSFSIYIALMHMLTMMVCYNSLHPLDYKQLKNDVDKSTESSSSEFKWSDQQWAFIGSLLLDRQVWVWNATWCGSQQFVHLVARAGHPGDVSHVCIGSVTGWMSVNVHLDINRLADWYAKMIDTSADVTATAPKAPGTTTASANTAVTSAENKDKGGMNQTDISAGTYTPAEEIPTDRKDRIENDKQIITLGLMKAFPDAPTFSNCSWLQIGNAFRSSYYRWRS